MSFGKYLRDLRLAKDMSQRELATKVGRDFTYISKIENDVMDPPSEETLIKIAEALGVNSDELILAAKKLPKELENEIIQNQDISQFLRSVKSKDISLAQEKWEKIKKSLEEN